MNQSITQHIKQIKKSIIYLDKINDKGALIMANNDLTYYETLSSGFSIPALINTVSN